jgi:hypothetical protein
MYIAMQTKELLRIAEEEEEAPAKPSISGTRIIDDAPEQRWDCESVLSLRSNLDNHPGVISEQSNRRYRSAGGKIRLAAKTGQHQRHVLVKCNPHGPESNGEPDRGLTCGCFMALLTCMCAWAYWGGGTGNWRILLSDVVCAVMLQCISHLCSTQLCC